MVRDARSRLGFLLNSSDVMLEYGHLYDLEGVGRFRSRFSPEEFASVDAARGEEAGRILASGSDDDYKEFLAQYTPITDPFVHEARVHLFRRDRYLTTSEWYPDDPEHRRIDLTVAHRENQFLERYFASTLANSGRALSPEKRTYLERDQIVEREYESKVSRNLVTRIGERHILAGGAALIALLVAVERVAARRSSSC